MYSSDSDDDLSSRPNSARSTTSISNGSEQQKAKRYVGDLVTPITEFGEEDNNFDALPGSLNVEPNQIFQHKMDRLKQAAQRQTPRMGTTMIQSNRPLSARGSRPLTAGGSESNMFRPATPNSQTPPLPPMPSTLPTLPNQFALGQTQQGSFVQVSDLDEENETPNSTPGFGQKQQFPQQSQYNQQQQQLLLQQLQQQQLAQLQQQLQLQQLQQLQQQQQIQSQFAAQTHPGFQAAAAQAGQQMVPQGIPQNPTFQGIDISDRRAFCSRPCPKQAGLLKCYVTRERGKLNRLFPKYYLWYEDKNEFLLSARKRKKNRSSNYLVSIDKDDQSRSSGYYFGKLRANFVGTEFIMYDRGENPKNAGDSKNLRSQLGAICYETNILGTKGPRKLTILLPEVGADGKYTPFPQTSENNTLIEKYKAHELKNMRRFRNKSPSWNEKLKAYVLNFNGRVTKASVKNFQLVDDENPHYVYLQFGKVSSDKFTLDFRWPFSAYQAFCVALSAFDIKIACE